MARDFMMRAKRLRLAMGLMTAKVLLAFSCSLATMSSEFVTGDVSILGAGHHCLGNANNITILDEGFPRVSGNGSNIIMGMMRPV